MTVGGLASIKNHLNFSGVTMHEIWKYDFQESYEIWNCTDRFWYNTVNVRYNYKLEESIRTPNQDDIHYITTLETISDLKEYLKPLIVLGELVL